MPKPMTRRQFLRRCLNLGAAAIATPTCGLFYSLRTESSWLQVERVTVTLSGLPPVLHGFTIAQMSDFHLGPTVSIGNLRQAVEVTRELKPDLIALTGDFVLGSAEYAKPCAQELAALRAPYGVMACLGNHDHWENASLIRRALLDARIPVLVNTGLSLLEGALWIAAVDDVWAGHPDLDAALAGVPGGAVVLLLAHEPDYADTVAEHGGVNLQLSGHSHGGQVRLPLIGAPLLPHLGQRYPAGLYHIGNLTLYTNRGVGTIYPPIRFNCRPEVTLITLTAES